MTKSRLIATNQNKIATRASPEAYDAWLLNHKICPDKYGGVRMAEKYGVPLLGQIPIVQSIRDNGDAGEPAALSSRPDGLAFLNLAEKLVKSVEMP